MKSPVGTASAGKAGAGAGARDTTKRGCVHVIGWPASSAAAWTWSGPRNSTNFYRRARHDDDDDDGGDGGGGGDSILYIYIHMFFSVSMWEEFPFSLFSFGLKPPSIVELCKEMQSQVCDKGVDPCTDHALQQWDLPFLTAVMEWEMLRPHWFLSI